MNEAMLSFLAIVEGVVPYTIAWGLGIKAYRYLTDALLGRNAKI